MEVRLPGLAGKNFFAMKAWRLGFSHRIRCCDCVLGLSRPPTYFFICWHADVLTVLRLLGALMTMIHVVNRKPEYNHGHGHGHVHFTTAHDERC